MEPLAANGSQRQRFAVPTASSSLAEIRAFATPILRKWAPTLADDLILALDECCANIIRHRAVEIEGGRIEVAIEASAERIRLRIGRFCRRGDVDRIKPRRPGEIEPGGLGTRFVAKIMDRVEYVPDPEQADVMDLVLEKRLSAPRAQPGRSAEGGASSRD